MTEKDVLSGNVNDETQVTVEPQETVEKTVIFNDEAEGKLKTTDDIIDEILAAYEASKPVVEGEGFTMEEPDPNVTYGGGFTMAESDPETVHGSGFTMKESDPNVVHGSGFTMQEPEQPAVPAVATTSKPAFYEEAETELEESASASYGLKGYDDKRYEPVPYKDDFDSYHKDAQTAESRSNRNSGADSGSAKAYAGYVTKKFLAGALALTLVVSSLLGGLLGSYLGRRGGSEEAQEPVNTEQPAGEETIKPVSTDKLSIEQIVSKNADAVVEINTTVVQMSMWGQMTGEGAGSGVIIREDGYIVTNFHVIEGARSVTVTLRNGSEYPAQIVGYDEQNDIAVIKIAADGLTAATPGDSDNLKVGDTTVAIGNPLGQLGGTATSGIISALDRTITMDDRTLTLLQTDSAINPGNSGGGLFDSKGELIGIVVAKSSGTGIEGLGFAIPINIAKPIYESIIENGHVTEKPMAGISIFNVSEDSTEYYGVTEPGVYIGEVTGRNANAAGLQVGDRIVAFDGEPVENSGELVAMIQQHKIGDEVTFTVSRDGQQLDITFALEAALNM